MIFAQVDMTLVETWQIYTQIGSSIAQVLGAIFVAFYVIFTYRTFRQIKKQTDYQQDAFLKLDPYIVSTFNSDNLVTTGGKVIKCKNHPHSKYLNQESANKMKDILKPLFQFDDSLYDGNFFTLVMTNYGNAEISKIKLSVTLLVENNDVLVEKKMLQKSETYSLEFEIDELIGRSQDSYTVALLPTASFPYYYIDVEGEYYDIRNKKYKIATLYFDGKNKHFHSIPEN